MAPEAAADAAAERSLLWWPLDALDWVTLGKVRNSLVGKAITVLSVTSLFLANAAPLLRDYPIPLESIERPFIGSLLFLCGSLVFAWRVPSQLATGSEIYEIVHRLRTLTDWRFFDGYRTLATGAQARCRGKSRFPPETLKLLDLRIAAASALTGGSSDWINQTAGLYQAYLELLKYDGLAARIASAALLWAGTLILFWPALHNVLTAISGMVC